VRSTLRGSTRDETEIGKGKTVIPYEELVAALATWRQRQGLPAGPADYLGEPAPASYDYQPVAGGAAGGYGEDVVELSDDLMDSVVEEQSNRYSVETEEMVDSGQLGSDTQDEDIDSYLDSAVPVEPPRPEPEPEPEPESGRSGGRRKRKK